MRLPVETILAPNTKHLEVSCQVRRLGIFANAKQACAARDDASDATRARSAMRLCDQRIPLRKWRIADGRADEWRPKWVRQWNEVEAVERAQGDTKSERTRAILHLSQDWGTKGG